MDKLLGENVNRNVVSATTSTDPQCDHVFHNYIEVDGNLVKVIDRSCTTIYSVCRRMSRIAAVLEASRYHGQIFMTLGFVLVLEFPVNIGLIGVA